MLLKVIMDSSCSRDRHLVKLALEQQKTLFSQYRIQGNSCIPSEQHNPLECMESDIDDDNDSDLDNSSKDPTWFPNNNNESDDSMHSETEDENLRIKRLYREATEQTRMRVVIETNDNTTPGKKRARPGRSDNEQWQKNRNKKLRMQGQKYLGLKKDHNGKYAYSIEREEREILPSKCSKRCKHCALFTENERTEIFNRFWNNMDWDQKKIFVCSMVDKFEAKKKTEDSRRNQSFQYHLKRNGIRTSVCKMILATLGIGQRTLYEWVNKSQNGVPDIRAKRQGIERNSDRIQSARDFLDVLPKMPSHYCRANSSKIYLEPVITSFNELYREYQRYCVQQEKQEICVKYFKRIFDDGNLSLYQSKKDQCDVCCSYETRNISIEECQLHIQRKDEARAEKVKDKDRCCDTVKVITLDLQGVLLCPLLKASSMYYKTKLGCHNFTIHDMSSHNVTCYFWDESEGELSANSFASCVGDYISNIDPGIKELVIFSDGCTYQNRNVTLSNTHLYYAYSKKITIIQKILEKGHTQMECNGVHSSIERKIRNKPIYSPQTYVDLIRDARPNQRYDVKYLTHQFFRNYGEMKYLTSIRPGARVGDPVVTDIRVLRYSTEGEIQYKLNFTDDFQDFPRKSKARQPSLNDEISHLYTETIPIKSSKYQHLQDLKTVIPRDYHPFYDNLSHK